MSRWMEDAAHLHVGALTQSRLIGPGGLDIPVEIAARRDGGRAVESDLMIYAVRDLRTRLAQERRIAHLARNDSLTGLPNRLVLPGMADAPDRRSRSLRQGRPAGHGHGSVQGGQRRPRPRRRRPVADPGRRADARDPASGRVRGAPGRRRVRRRRAGPASRGGFGSGGTPARRRHRARHAGSRRGLLRPQRRHRRLAGRRATTPLP